MTLQIFSGPALAVALLASGQALAQTAPAPAPAPAVPAPDPARMEAARRVTAKLVPQGSYKKILDNSLGEVMGPLMQSMGEMPIRDIAALGGLDEDQARALGDAKLAEIMAIYDPHWRERTDVMMKAMMPLISEIVGKMEPRIREAMARAYARDFTVEQLNTLNSFFETPTGAIYAARQLELAADPEVMKESTAIMPEMMQEMPRLVEKLQEAEAGIPPARKISELSDAERKKLAGLLGVRVEALDDPGKVLTQ